MLVYLACHVYGLDLAVTAACIAVLLCNNNNLDNYNTVHNNTCKLNIHEGKYGDSSAELP